MRKTECRKKVWGITGALVLLLTIINPGIAGAKEVTKSDIFTSEVEDNTDLLSMIHDTISYEEYLKDHTLAAHPTKEIVIDGGNFIEASPGFKMVDNYQGLKGSTVLTLEEGEVSWNVLPNRPTLWSPTWA